MFFYTFDDTNTINLETMLFNPLSILVSAIVVFAVGFIWYHPKVFGTTWMQETGMTDEKIKQGNMFKIFGLSFIFSILVAFSLSPIVIHQFGALQATGGLETDPAFISFMEVHGSAFRTFKHGALHGFLMGLFFVIPITAINGLYEHKSWKYIMITGGYWLLSLTIMGAIICGWV